jgi:hypothetical protein
MVESTRAIAVPTPRASPAGGPLAARTIRVTKVNEPVTSYCASGTYSVAGTASRSDR